MGSNLDFVEGAYVWIKSSDKNEEFDIPIGGKILSINQDRLVLEVDNGHETSIAVSQIDKPMHTTSIQGVEDMINLGDLQECAILRNLQIRYQNKLIYTYTGSMLVAVNPYEVLPIYTNAVIKEYKERKIGELPPHIFAIGNGTYSNLKDTKQNQCIVISGESGAGKTESTKLLLQYLTAISGKHSWVEQQILEANPIMEAFGNAKTVRNDNSSRFGKYIEVTFNDQGIIEGAKIEQYLLEKSRIVSQSKGERNYHIFYCMLEGLTEDEKKRLNLNDASDYHYLKKGNVLICPGRNEVSEFAGVRGAMKVLNFSNEECWEIFQLLAAILHLGNLEFKEVTVSNIDTSEITDPKLASNIASLLGLNTIDLIRALTKRSISAQGEKVVSDLDKKNATETRDAFVKGIYGKMFVTIINKINKAIQLARNISRGSIGVLDIFGFENFRSNSFEQFCINYANENLQQFFVQHIFKMEQEHYAKEEIDWTHIEFVDNQVVLDMIGVKPLNIIALIDEEAKFPKGTDLSMLSKLHNTHSSKEIYSKPKSDAIQAFGVQHFAGSVLYDVIGFLEKNRDVFSQDLRQVIRSSANIYLKKLFEIDSLQDTKRMATISSQFRTSLDDLLQALGACNPFFIRCIKPNEDKQPRIFDRALCYRQLRYSGMMETAHIRQAGYPILYTYIEFVERYRHLAKNIPHAQQTDCIAASKKICMRVFKNNEDYQFGNTRIFLKTAQNEILEAQRRKIWAYYIVIVQKAVRRWICRTRYLQKKLAVITIQKHFRARGYRSKYLIMHTGYQRLQAVILSKQLVKHYQKKRQLIIGLQAHCKGYIIRNYHQFGKIVAVVHTQMQEENELKQAGNNTYKHLAESNMQKRLAELNRAYVPKEEERLMNKEKVDLDGIVDKEFNFLEDIVSHPLKKKSKQTTISNSVPEYEPDLDLDLSAYNFRKFAATYFVKNTSPQYSKTQLKESLLDLPTPDDIIAAQTIWIIILRFMTDLPEPNSNNNTKNRNIMNMLRETFSRSFANRKEFQEITRQEKEQSSMTKIERQAIISMTLKRKHKLLEDVRMNLVEDKYATDIYNDWLNKRTTNLEKIHFIIGHGILRLELRDEIFCQICKQLTNNPSKASHARGWILLCLCVASFPPSERFTNYLRAFIRDGPSGYAPYCEERLNRTFKNSPRTQPPSWLELEAAKNKERINLKITFMDNTIRDVDVDFATTSEELCHQIASSLNLKDPFGFSLFITLFDKVMSLGNDADHVMDAVSQCEQHAKAQGVHESQANWRMFFRKEIFTPWHDPELDSVGTDLIYNQVVKGLKFGEYKSPTEGDIAMLASQQYYVENGSEMNVNTLRAKIGEYLPGYLVKQGEPTIQLWETRIINASLKSACVKQKYPILKAKEDMVRYAKAVWPISFSRFFEAMRISGPMSKDNIFIAINSTGVYMIDNLENILLELSFIEIAYIGYEQMQHSVPNKLLLNTIRNEEFVFHCQDAKSINKLVAYLLDGLKTRSIHCVAVNDYKHPGDAANFISFRRGDLVTLKGFNGNSLMSSTWGYGECNGRTGNFPTEQVQILPTLQKPTADILSAFKSKNVFEPRQPTVLILNTVQRQKLYTLAAYAEEHFRLGNKTATAGIVVSKPITREELWKYTNQPILQPLLKKLSGHEEAAQNACRTFKAILQYMGDLPGPAEKTSNEYTNEIFAPPLTNNLLKDEVYCQIMRQLTYNRLSLSEERGWELMYLATGLFICSASLMSELQKFLKSRIHPLVHPCLRRLKRTQKIGQRKFPPYAMEVDAIQQRNMQIYQKIYFPDDSEEAVEIDSMTRASELCSILADRLDLVSTDGFSLFVVVLDKIFSVPNEDFFYDFLYEHKDWINNIKSNSNGTAVHSSHYQVFLMKKLWVNTVPRSDPNADHVFHYYQELPKYLHGFHKCTVHDSINLASLIYRAKYDDNILLLSQINLKELLPASTIKVQSPADWRKDITVTYNAHGKISPQEAKSRFLEVIYEWPMFGSNFFEVKQSTHSTYPEDVVIAINKDGVAIMHPHTKDVLSSHAFSELNNWGSGRTFFQFTIGNVMKAIKFLCETAQGYKMDDLITSYTEYLRRNEHTS